MQTRLKIFYILFFTPFLLVPLVTRASTLNFQSLSEGSRGPEVLELQQKLQQKGYFPATARLTEYFGKITKQAVMAFQKAKNLGMVGKFGPLTNKALAQVAIPETTSLTALPLYIYPSATEPNWTTAINAGGSKVDFIVANVNSGPGTSAKSTWTNMISRAVAAGIKVYGYVDTNYATKSGSTVDSEIASWFQFYPQVTGIFLDRASSGASQIPYYKSRYDYVKNRSTNFKVVLNPGTITDEGYMAVSDVNIIFESLYSSWLTKVIPTWVANYPKERFYAIVYGVPAETTMKDVVRTAKARNFGRVFVTNATGPSSPLPFYFQAELTEITASPVVNGICGTANNTAVSTVPTTNLCSSGTAGTVAGSDPWTWSCAGQNGGTTAGCSAQKIAAPSKTAVPLYIYPSVPLYSHPSASESNWTALINAGGSKVDFVVANVNSGPGTSAQSTWTNVINKAVASGIKVYGYVDTNYGATSGATVDSKVASWFKFYPQISGIFFDRTATNATLIPYYKTRYSYVKNINSSFQVVISPGAITDEGYMQVSDVNLMFAGSYSSWLTKTMPSWVFKYPKERFFTIIFSASLDSQMKDAVKSAKARNFGRIFVTSASGLSSALPSYFQAELAEIAGTAVSAPLSPTPINGVCGSANNITISTVPSYNLCSAGTASAVSGSGPWSWSCVGQNGGTSAGCVAQKVSVTPVSSRTFTEDTALNVRNPERGLYYPINLFSNTLADCQSAVSKGYTIVYAEAILPKNTDLRLGVSDSDQPRSGDFIGKIRDGLAAVRSCGAKAIVRFYYLKGGSGEDPALTTITSHITQIKTVLAENSDVVMVFQAGFAGYWGEWHGSTRAESATDRTAILNAILAALPANRMVQVRTPGKRHQVFSGTSIVSSANAIGGTAPGAPLPFSGTNPARTGHYDDCFMGTLRDYGTYSSFGSSAYNEQVAYVAQNSRFTPIGGESCRFAKRDATTMVYTYDPTETYRYTDLAHIRARAKKEMATMHWSFLNGTYSEEVRDSMGGNAGLALIDPNADPRSNDNSGARTVADNNCPNGVFDSPACIYEGFYPEMLKRLGYRLVLLNSSFSSQVRSEGAMQIDFALRNIGFAAMFNARPVYLVLHNGTNRYNIPLTGVDPRTWESKSDANGTSIVNSTSIINVSYTVNRLPVMAAGTYSVSLWLPDQAISLQPRPQYSVRFANTNMWNSTLGLNLLAADAVVVAP